MGGTDSAQMLAAQVLAALVQQRMAPDSMSVRAHRATVVPPLHPTLMSIWYGAIGCTGGSEGGGGEGGGGVVGGAGGAAGGGVQDEDVHASSPL